MRLLLLSWLCGLKKSAFQTSEKMRERKETLADMGENVSGGGTKEKNNITGRTCPPGPNAPTGEGSRVQSEARSRSAESPRTELPGSWGEREDLVQTAASANPLGSVLLTCSRTRGRWRRRAQAGGGCSGCPCCCCSCRSCARW